MMKLIFPNHSNSKDVEQIDSTYYFQCPNCDDWVVVEHNEIACRIFRHGYFKQPGHHPIPPHLPKDQCEDLLRQKLVVDGCAKPFEFCFAQPKNYVQVCDYTL